MVHAVKAASCRRIPRFCFAGREWAKAYGAVCIAARRKAKNSNAADIRPLYTSEDVEPMLGRLTPMRRSGGFDVSPEFQVESFDAGHILGSSSLRLTIREGGKNTTVVFSGDVGRYSQPILNDPATPTGGGDYVICESTYGDREHPEGDPLQLLADIGDRVEK